MGALGEMWPSVDLVSDLSLSGLFSVSSDVNESIFSEHPLISLRSRDWLPIGGRRNWVAWPGQQLDCVLLTGGSRCLGLALVGCDCTVYSKELRLLSESLGRCLCKPAETGMTFAAFLFGLDTGSPTPWFPWPSCLSSPPVLVVSVFSSSPSLDELTGISSLASSRCFIRTATTTLRRTNCVTSTKNAK